MQINEPSIVAEVAAASVAYERALVDNDVDTLTGYFWESPHALRFGVAEELYGADEITAFRKARKVSFPDRKSLRQTVVTIGPDFAIVTIEFSVTAFGNPRHGRQSQVWVRFPDLGWRVVSAHVSHKVTPQNAAAFNPNTASVFAAAAAALLKAPVDPIYRDGVAANLDVMARVAGPLMETVLPDAVEAAARFIP